MCIRDRAAEDMQRIVSQLAEESAAIRYEEELSEELQDESNRISYGNIHKGIHIHINRMGYVPEEYRISYQKVFPALHPISKRLQKQVSQILIDSKTGGKLDLSLIHISYEMLLWSSLSWNILTFDETRALFYEREQEMHILSDLDFEYYLKRLIFRGLVVSGTGYSGISALHQLLAPLYVHSCADRLLEKLAALADMVCLQHYPLRTAVRIFRKEKLTVEAVSYTHLDVYKRQVWLCSRIILLSESWDMPPEKHLSPILS